MLALSGTGGPYPVSSSVDVDSGITLDAAYYLWKGSTPAGPKNQSAANVTDAVKALPGLSSATLVDEGRLTSGDNAGSDSTNVYVLHWADEERQIHRDIVLVFSGDTTLTDVMVPGLRNFRSFDPPLPTAFDSLTPTTPLPAALPLFATALGGLGLLGWRRKRKAQAVVA